MGGGLEFSFPLQLPKRLSILLVDPFAFLAGLLSFSLFTLLSLGFDFAPVHLIPFLFCFTIGFVCQLVRRNHKTDFEFILTSLRIIELSTRRIFFSKKMTLFYRYGFLVSFMGRVKSSKSLQHGYYRVITYNYN